MAKFISESTDVPRSADVVVIGGGPAGTGVVWALGRLAPQLKVVLVEQSERLGAGSSLASLENYRTCWPATCLAHLMARSIEIFENADDYLGDGAAQSLAMKRRGYLFCGFTPTQADTLKRDVEHLHGIGLTHVEYLDADECRARYPWLGDRLIAAKYDPIAGWLDSNALIHRYVQATDSVRVLLGAKDVTIRVTGGQVVGVSTSLGHIDAPVVVIACGANAVLVGSTAGAELPLVMRPRQSFTTGTRHADFPEDAPMVIGAAPFPHVRPEAQSGAIFGWEYAWNSKNTPGLNGAKPADSLVEPIFPAEPLKDPRFPSLALALLARQFGHTEGEGFADTRYLRGVRHNIGYYVSRSGDAAYTIKEDGSRHPYESERAIIDAHPEVAGLFVSIAHVGHGIMSSSAAGEILARKIMGQAQPDPLFEQFSFDTHWVAHDENAL